MMHRSNPPQARTATSIDVQAALLRSLTLAAAGLLVLVLITVLPGAGTGFA